jgi:hypothetical protein
VFEGSLAHEDSLGHSSVTYAGAERRGVLRVVASQDGRTGSLLGRSAWLHVVRGEATLGNVILTTGDSAGIASERAVSLTAQQKTEILLLDLACP